MKKNKLIMTLSVLVILLAGMSGCSDSSSDVSSNKKQPEPDAISQGTDDSSQLDDSSTDSTAKSDNSVDSNENELDSTLSEEENSSMGDKEEKEGLSQYSSEQIEYARIWLQLGPNQEIDELNVRHISAGEPINIYDDTSATYPKDVISLSGSRSVDGSVTYSSNGDGTINVYDVPLHWTSPAQVEEGFMKEYTENIIKEASLVSVDPGDDEEIIKFINLINVHQ